MGYFSLKDVNKKSGSNPILYYQIYSSANYKSNVKKRKPGRNSEITYQNMSRNNVMICLGPYSPVMNERYLKAVALEKAMNHFIEGKITKDDLNDIEQGFKVTEQEEEKLFQDFALIQFKRFFECVETRKIMDGMTYSEKKEAALNEWGKGKWATNKFEETQKEIIAQIREHSGVGQTEAKMEYLRRKFEEYKEIFTKEDVELAKAAESKINKKS